MSDSIQHWKRDTYGKNIEDLSNRIWYQKKNKKKKTKKKKK